jgi:type IV pilus assembly protein PilM
MATGIDIGANSIRIAQVERYGEGFRVAGLARLKWSLQPGQTPENASIIAQAVGRLVANSRSKPRTAVMGLTGRDLILRISKVPRVAADRLSETMQHEVKSVAGKSEGEVYSDYRLLDMINPMDPDIPMLIGLGKSAFIDERVSGLKRAGIDPREICPNSLAVMAAYCATNRTEPSETVLILDIGAQNTEIVIQRGGKLILARNVSVGGKFFTDTIKNTINLPESEAEKFKIQDGTVSRAPIPNQRAETARLALLNAAGQIHSVINSSIQFARTQAKLPELTADKVVLSGGGARLMGLAEYLKDLIGKPVVTFNPLEGMDVSGMTPEAVEDAGREPSDMTVAIGLAVIGCTQPSYALSLIPTAVKNRAVLLRHTLPLIGAAAVLVFALIVLVLDGMRTRGRLKASVDDLRKREQALESRRASLESVKVDLTAAAGNFEVLCNETQGGALVLTTLSRISGMKPDEMWLSEVKLEQPGMQTDGGPPAVRVKGYVQEADDALDILNRFVQQLNAANSPVSATVTRPPYVDDSGRTGFELSIGWAQRSGAAEGGAQ